MSSCSFERVRDLNVGNATKNLAAGAGFGADLKHFLASSLAAILRTRRAASFRLPGA